MTSKKVCLLGSIAVGKTSLVRRFVEGAFSDQYLMTIGVRVDKKTVDVDGRSVTLILWDLAGEDTFNQVQTTYLRGAAAYIVVVDGTRPNTLDKALELQERAERTLGGVPCVFALNKCDLVDQWTLIDGRLEALRMANCAVCRTSAKHGTGVEQLFSTLAARLAT